MNMVVPDTMRAAAMDRFGGPETIRIQTLPVPQIGADDVLLRVETAGVGAWDPYEREGGFAELFGRKPSFPYVLGSEGAGTVVAVGDRVERFKPGDRVYAIALANPKGGFYAEYAAVPADYVSMIPDALTVEQAGVTAVDAVTGLQGLDDALGLQEGETVLIFGASGGIGHMATQLAKRMGARVFAVASGDDGVALARQLGADAVVNGRKEDVVAAAREFAPEGIDAALLTAGGEAAQDALAALRDGGRFAYPTGVRPEPSAPPNATGVRYDGIPGPEVYEKLQRLIEAGPFDVRVARTFPLEQAAEAHRALEGHFLGKLALLPTAK
jgi:NADPH:quinone reductase-like Zn-dependent oxidoreductase